MKKILYIPKLNQSLNKYLAFANTSNTPATASQSDFDFGVFFDSAEMASKAVDSYLTHPSCKMSIDNKKFISIEPYEFEYEFNKFPFTDHYTLINTSDLKDSENCIFRKVQLQYGDFNGFCYICPRAYKSI